MFLWVRLKNPLILTESDDNLISSWTKPMSSRLLKSPAYKHNLFKEEEKNQVGLSRVMKKGTKHFSE